MPIRRHVLICKNKDCEQPIVLPPSIHLGTSPHRVPWPKDELPRNFLCRSCNRVYEYTLQDVRPALDEKQDQERPNHDDTVFRLEGGCAGQNCEAQVRILAVGPQGSGTMLIKSFWLRSAIYEKAKCLEGRLCPGLLAGNVSAQIDPDWE
jgi:hypothetical protein